MVNKSLICIYISRNVKHDKFAIIIKTVMPVVYQKKLVEYILLNFNTRLDNTYLVYYFCTRGYFFAQT